MRGIEMAPYYRIVTSTAALPLDQSLLERMEKENKDELDKIEERLEEAKKTEGETDIADALRARANYLTRIGDKVCIPTLRTSGGGSSCALLVAHV